MGSHRNGFNKESFILSVDVGTTSIRCHVVPLYPEVGHVEMDPEAIWEGFITVVKGAVQDAGVHMRQIEALGISTQRGTFTTWDRRDEGALLLHQTETVAGSKSSRLLPQHVTFRLVWALTHYKQVRQAATKGNCCFGTIDTWLLFKLTKGQVHATDYSNASATGMFDAFQVYDFGYTDPSIFGLPIPIMSVIADQQAAMFGECCFDVGDVKITMGTGTFMDINTGNKPHTSSAGLYPLVGWKIGSEVVYLAEGNAADTGTAIKWAQELELFSDVQETSDMAYSVSDSDGVCFVPSFNGLQAPLNDPKACASLMGLKPSTTKSHLVRAILESVAFRNKQLYDTTLRETHIPITKIRVDGGVSSNNFVMQLTADLFGRKVSRPHHYEMSCLGAAFVAGLGVGYWRSREELKKLQRADDAFLPKGVPNGSASSPSREYIPVIQSWEKALRRSMNWYKP
ncbi:hypothetical protein F7725_011956 [Dissostichus mawsoni]|uniref:Glycerol kinase 5 n=1 Tax=Dissostichus mawsoni TaxID=36200 RepID=A0A7J5ZAE8_DISMA|nr:hypothetical protein F7725_011956 [Dissostichus mawsoni]